MEHWATWLPWSTHRRWQIVENHKTNIATGTENGAGHLTLKAFKPHEIAVIKAITTATHALRKCRMPLFYHFYYLSCFTSPVTLWNNGIDTNLNNKLIFTYT